METTLKGSIEYILPASHEAAAWWVRVPVPDTVRACEPMPTYTSQPAKWLHSQVQQMGRTLPCGSEWTMVGVNRSDVRCLRDGFAPPLPLAALVNAGPFAAQARTAHPTESLGRSALTALSYDTPM